MLNARTRTVITSPAAPISVTCVPLVLVSSAEVRPLRETKTS